VFECPHSGYSVLSWEDDVTGKQPVLKRVEADGGFTLQSLWSRGAARVSWLAVFRRPFTRSVRRLRKLNSWAAISESYQGLGMI
jgi:hypothetical protein